MNKFFLLSMFLASVVLADWPGLSIVSVATGGPLTDYTESDPSDEYQDSDVSDTLGICWKTSYARYGTPLTTKCDKGLIQIGAYCYHPCKEGYVEGYFSGTDSFADQYPASETETSDVESYCWEDCPKDYPESYVETCGKGNLTITRKHYNRTYVDQLECPHGYEYFYNKCYPLAKEGFTCGGPLCYGKCPHGWYECGALCTREGLCEYQVLYEGFDVDDALSDMAYALKHPSQGHLVNATAVPGVSNGTQYPWCH